MSFLKISDPTKRDQTVKEYLELKKNIRDNLLSERTGEQQLQTELTKFYRPITEAQKATTSNAAKQIASSALDVGKSVATEGAKKALEAGKSAAVDVGKKLVTKALMPKSKKILQKYTTPPQTQNISTLMDGSAIKIQELVKKLNGGSGIKKA